MSSFTANAKKLHSVYFFSKFLLSDQEKTKVDLGKITGMTNLAI